jgi:hypothetical protein
VTQHLFEMDLIHNKIICLIECMIIFPFPTGGILFDLFLLLGKLALLFSSIFEYACRVALGGFI